MAGAPTLKMGLEGTTSLLTMDNHTLARTA